MTDVLTETAPKRIWLQVDPDAPEEDRSEPCPDPMQSELTWCWHRIGGQEVEYVRADLVRAAMPGDADGRALHRLRLALGITDERGNTTANTQ